MRITRSAAAGSCWAEVYFDGIGWLPVDVTPGYYYDAVKLQQMVATPDMVHKTLAEDHILWMRNRSRIPEMIWIPPWQRSRSC